MSRILNYRVPSEWTNILDTVHRYSPILIFLLVTVGLFSCAEIAVDGQHPDQTEITETQSKLIFRECQDLPNQTEVSIALIENGTVRFYGIKRLNDTIFSVDNHQCVFEIGSISKVFTATLLAGLSLEKKIILDEPIREYIGLPLKDSIEITFEQLANHTSGLPRLPSNLSIFSVDLQNPYKDYDQVKLAEYLATEIALEDPPGARFRYSNLGVGLLGFTLTKIEGNSYEDLLQARIFSKYQMTSSTTNRTLVKNVLVTGLNSKGRETPNWDLNVLTGAGGILSSVSDLSRFAIAQFDSSNEILALTRRTTYNGYLNGSEFNIGLGWMIKERPDGKWFWHNGATGGYSSSMQVNVENGDAVIILTNVSGLSSKRVNIDSLSDRLIGTLENSS